MPRLRDFEGSWTLDRRIDDRRGGQSGRLGGTARFEVSGGGLVYREEGTLELASGPVLPARQTHLWRAEPPEIDVRFADGRSFHRFDAGAGNAQGRHLCGADLYVVVYDFTRWPRWSARWTVTGPVKDYTTFSAYVGR